MVNARTPARPQMTGQHHATSNSTPFCLPPAPDTPLFAQQKPFTRLSRLHENLPPVLSFPFFPAYLPVPTQAPKGHHASTTPRHKKVKCVRACVRERARASSWRPTTPSVAPASRASCIIHPRRRRVTWVLKRYISTTPFILLGGAPCSPREADSLLLFFYYKEGLK